MPAFHLMMVERCDAEIQIEATDAHDAINIGLNALSQFAFHHFPPTEEISIVVHDAEKRHVATFQLAFKIYYGKGITL